MTDPAPVTVPWPSEAEVARALKHLHAHRALGDGMRAALQAAAAPELARRDAEIERLRAELIGARMCGVCAGTGIPISGKPCICGGTGLQGDEVAGLRLALFHADNDNERLRAALAALQARCDAAQLGSGVA